MHCSSAWKGTGGMKRLQLSPMFARLVLVMAGVQICVAVVLFFILPIGGISGDGDDHVNVNASKGSAYGS